MTAFDARSSIKSGTATAISVRSLSKSYGGPPVLDDLDLEVTAGEIVAIMGRSGSGKTTLLKLVGALDSPDSGQILHGGVDLATLDERERTRFRRRSLGFVFQFFNLIPTLTVLENITLPLALNGWRRGDMDDRARAFAGELALGDLQSKFPDQLSGGEQQRVAIARALVHEPGIIVADEPTGNLDSETAARTLALLRAACRQSPATLIMATHSDEAAAIADRVLHMRDGRISRD